MPYQDDAQFQSLRLSFVGDVAHLVIERPEKKNALSAQMWRRLTGCVREAVAGQARALVISGAGKDFCAGADIGEFDELRSDADSAQAYEATNTAAFSEIRNAPIPTIASIRGVCFGGGFGIAAACDIRIASHDARFAVPAAKLGLAYPPEAMQDIVWACGSQLARYLTFTAAPIDAPRALAAGFLLELVPDDELDDRAATMAAAMAANAPMSIAAAKAAIRAVQTSDSAYAEQAQRLGQATFSSDDYAEGRAAFRERRPPRFGRSMPAAD